MTTTKSLESTQNQLSQEDSTEGASLPKADWGLRVAAYIYDALAATLLGFIAYVILGGDNTWLLVFEIFFLFNFCIGWKLGQTIGMWPLKIKVVTIDGKPLGWGRVIWRYIAFTISLFSIIGMVWILFDKQKQGLHDKLAKTYVIKINSI